MVKVGVSEGKKKAQKATEGRDAAAHRCGFYPAYLFHLHNVVMAVHRGLDLDLPESMTAHPTKEDFLSISVKHIDNNNTELLVLINETRVDVENLGEELRLSRHSRQKQQALIFAEETISYQDLFKVLDQLKMVGITQISLQANRGEE